ncbi:hypothetical protein [Stakelama saccharophila]|uniref:Flap endonuclease-1-like 5' DNA nuclease n=1 Tax=Stakelama saccharophila TaxID=3075605 RepID=A0ABZ0B8H7_9SPHN|nr:hypothetical protein [Stakelama sp. W311]WNO53335.1 hypothetical protein RPR59_12910 [Stakelama sp. W311]
MIFETTTQFAVLALALIAGWFFGLASHPGGRRWKERYRTLEAENKAYREERDRVLAERDERIRELEHERDRLHRDAAATGAANTAGTAAAAHHEAGRHDANRGWFGWGRDNLSRIRGIDEPLEKRLNEHGIKTYKAIEVMTAEDADKLEAKLDLGAGRIEREHWREQAAMLREGKDEDHARNYV